MTLTFDTYESFVEKIKNYKGKHIYKDIFETDWYEIEPNEAGLYYGVEATWKRGLLTLDQYEDLLEMIIEKERIIKQC